MMEEELEAIARTNAGIAVVMNFIARLLVKLPPEEEALIISDVEMSMIQDNSDEDPYLTAYSIAAIEKCGFVQQLCAALRGSE